METTALCISVLLLFASLYYFLCKIIPVSSRKHVAAAAHPLPPGSQGWPFIGETLEYLSTARHGVPEKFIDDRRNKYSDDDDVSCKVFRTSLLGEPVAMLCTAAGNKFLFSNENKLVKSWWPSVFSKLFTNSNSTTSEKHSDVTINNRKTVFPFLKPDAVRNHIGIMDQVTKEHFKNHYWLLKDEKQVIKFHSLVKKFTLALSSRLFLNLRDPRVIEKIEESITQINEGLVSLPIDLPGTNFSRAIRASRKMKMEIDRMVKQRKIDLTKLSTIDREQLGKTPQDLMSSSLLQTWSDDKLTEDAISKYMCTVILAGFDSIVNTLCATVIVLSQLPQVYDAVLKEQMEIAESKNDGELLNWEDVRKMKYTWNVVCEVLRLQPPASGAFREAISDFLYEGYLIPKGMKLHWNVYATHKNPEYFPDPHEFHPSRFEGHGPPPCSYVPFGGGPRMCPGKEHARYEMLVFLHNFVTGFKWEMVYPDEKMVVDPVPFPSKGLPLYVSQHI